MPQPTSRPSGGRGQHSGLRWNWWNLLLLVPFLMLVTPWFNSIEPQLFGMPFFYWSQFAWVPVGVACVAIVYFTTRDEATTPSRPDELDVDDLDERTAR